MSIVLEIYNFVKSVCQWGSFIRKYKFFFHQNVVANSLGMNADFSGLIENSHDRHNLINKPKLLSLWEIKEFLLQNGVKAKLNSYYKK